MLGGGATAFMRLGHHTEAEQAASYIGRQHTFVLSQLTATLGGNETHTRTDTEGQASPTPSRRLAPGLDRRPSGGGSRNGGPDPLPTAVTTSRNWSDAQSWATGTNWSDAADRQRVYEYAVEPSVLQNLPDQALLLTARGSGRPVTCARSSATPPSSPCPGSAPCHCPIAPPPPQPERLPPRSRRRPGSGAPSRPGLRQTHWPAWADPGAAAGPPELPPVPASRPPSDRQAGT